MVINNMTKKATTRLQIILTAIVMIALAGVTMSFANVDNNDSNISEERLQELFLQSFQDLNLTMTNVYVNETYLNQTYITNEYYETINQYTTNVDNRTYNEFITQITNQIIEGLEPINIQSLDSINLSSNNYSEIDFYVRNSNLGAITDSLGLNLISQPEIINNPNFENSIFVNPENNQVITNNVIINDGSLNTGQDALIHDNNGARGLDLEFNSTLKNRNLYINLAFDWDEVNNLFEIRENDVTRIRLESEGSGEILVRDVVNGVTFGGIELNDACDSAQDFCTIQFDFDEDFVKVYSYGVLIGEFDNTFNSSESRINIVGVSSQTEDLLIRSLYLQQEEIEIFESRYTLESESHELDTNEWKNVNIQISPSTIYYKIGDNFHNIDYNDEYILNLDLTRTDVANLFGKEISQE